MDYLILEYSRPNTTRAYPISKYSHAFRIIEKDGNVAIFGIYNNLSEILDMYIEKNIEWFENSAKLQISERGKSTYSWKCALCGC